MDMTGIERARGAELRDAAVAWLAAAPAADPAAPAVAAALEEATGAPSVVVRGPAGSGAGDLAAALAADPAARDWRVRGEEGPVARRHADALIVLDRDPGRTPPPGGAVAAPGSAPGALREIVATLLEDAPRIAAGRVRRLKRGIAEAAAAHPSSRDGLEALLWP
ncbi:hypothetical protein [Corynebacterium sp.]|uniref:hypothetical protein n=1 Tax=Corynebacterium sp. TaxID=1720 RepID=UPI0026DC811F|nr:hypothetical protein [Corynebacterium sp.]MDO4610273.1 hypothetical protein [Corynebacterium sp.]